MLFVRAATPADLDEIAQMARAAQPVLHSLPHDRERLDARIAASDASFRAQVETPGEESYLFVLEDADTGRLAGTSSVTAAAGYPEPFYVFRNDALIHASRELNVNRTVHVLTMSHELTGLTRLAGFYADPSLPAHAAQLISRARMMFVAMHRRRFASHVFSLLLGVTGDDSRSPFWEAVGRKFFGRDFREIEVQSGGRSRTFIAEVMPAWPLYVPLLPAGAQRVIGEPDPGARLAYGIHLDEGLVPDRYVDIFDAGPVLMAPVERTASVARHETRVVVDARDAGADRDERQPVAYLVASGHAHEFRCVEALLPSPALSPDHAAANAPLDAQTRAVLRVERGDTVHCVPLRRDGDRERDHARNPRGDER